jgi:hypothetical protein
MLKLNKQLKKMENIKEMLKLIYFDLETINQKEIKKDNLYHLKLAKGNLKDSIQTIERGETWKKKKQ